MSFCLSGAAYTTPDWWRKGRVFSRAKSFARSICCCDIVYDEPGAAGFRLSAARRGSACRPDLTGQKSRA